MCVNFCQLPPAVKRREGPGLSSRIKPGMQDPAREDRQPVLLPSLADGRRRARDSQTRTAFERVIISWRFQSSLARGRPSRVVCCGVVWWGVVSLTFLSCRRAYRTRIIAIVVDAVLCVLAKAMLHACKHKRDDGVHQTNPHSMRACRLIATQRVKKPIPASGRRIALPLGRTGTHKLAPPGAPS